MPYQTFSPSGVAPPPPQTWSNIKVHSNGNFHVAGIVGGGDSMYEQARNTFDAIRKLIEAAGGVMDDIMTLQIFVTNLDENTEVWRARREFFTGDFPASTLVEVSALAAPEILVEIEAIAYIGKGRR